MGEYIRDACPTFQPIDEAIPRLPKGWASIGIDLCWPDYDQLLRLYGIRARAEDSATWGGGEYLTRPMKLYKGKVVRFVQHASQICGRYPDGSITCVPLARSYP